ncbi:MAG: ABC transporter ATP-binding protein [Oscillospiraceae bacterium]
MRLKKEDKGTLKWLFNRSRHQLWRILTIIIGYGLFAVISVVFALMCRGIIDSAVGHSSNGLIKYGIALFCVIFFQMILQLYCNSAVEYVRCSLGMSIRKDMLDKLLKKDYSSISTYHSGELLNRMFSDVDSISDGITTLLPTLTNMVTQLICAISVLIAMDKKFTMIFIIAGIFTIFISLLFRKKMKFLHKNVQQKQGIMRSFLQETLENSLIIKVFGCEKKMEQTNDVNQKNHFAAQMKRRSLSICANAGFGFVFQVGYFIALIWGARGIFLGTLTYGTLTAILQLVNQIKGPFANLSGLLPKFYGVIASAERIIELENLPEEEESEKRLNYKEFDKIEIKDMSFSYGDNHVLKDVNLDIEKGDFISLTGLSGGGKSTLFHILLGAYYPCSGTVEYLSRNGGIFKCGKETRSLFAYVPQGNILFSGTIKENMLMLNDNASDEDIIAAAKIACAYDFIKELPDGFDTKIGENSLGVSEGQAQRIAITRAILSNAPILLLDEATSALDEQTEAQLLQNISALKNRTCLIVTHRPAALSICNKHLILDDGNIYYGDVQTSHI